MADRTLPVLAILAAAALYLALAAGVLLGPDTALVGTKIYDYYFLSLTEGRFDIPPRVATLEGHYDADGRAYVYHGLAPMLTRLAAWPFADLRTADWLAPATVWAFALAGTLAYHLTAMATLEAFGPDGRSRRIWQAILLVMVWLCAPGLVLAANHSVFHEPTAVAYFAMAWSIFLYARVALFGADPARVLLGLALLAALALFARPHVAVALYLGVGLMALLALARSGLERAGPVLGAGLILGLAGVALLGFNAARFGDPLQMFGSNDQAAVQYGFTYWGLETPADTERMAAFIEHGTFNLGRVLPNLMVYAVDIPWGQITGDPMRNEGGPVDNLYRAMTADLGFIRVEAPRIGFLYLWAPWLVLALWGLLTVRPGANPALPDGPQPAPGRSAAAAIALVAALVAAVFILAYGTVTLRYRVEVFPLLAVAGLWALPRILAAEVARGRAAIWPRALLGLAAAGCGLVSLGVAAMYADNFPQLEVVSRWSRETCEALVLEKGFAEADLDRLCGL